MRFTKFSENSHRPGLLLSAERIADIYFLLGVLGNKPWLQLPHSIFNKDKVKLSCIYVLQQNLV